MDLSFSSSFIPKYKLIQKYIVDEIEAGRLKKGDRIPSELQLSEMFGVSRITANSAIKELTTLGIIKRTQGLGSYVADDQLNTGTGSSMLFGQNTKIALKDNFMGTKEHRLISSKIIKADAHIREILELNEDEPVYEIIRSTGPYEDPEDLDLSYIPARIYEAQAKRLNSDLAYTEKELCHCYFHEYLKNILGLRCKYERVYLRPDISSFAYASELNIGEDDIVLLWDLVVYDEMNNPLGLTTTLSKKAGRSAFLTFEL